MADLISFCVYCTTLNLGGSWILLRDYVSCSSVQVLHPLIHHDLDNRTKAIVLLLLLKEKACPQRMWVSYFLPSSPLRRHASVSGRISMETHPSPRLPEHFTKSSWTVCEVTVSLFRDQFVKKYLKTKIKLNHLQRWRRWQNNLYFNNHRLRWSFVFSIRCLPFFLPFIRRGSAFSLPSACLSVCLS